MRTLKPTVNPSIERPARRSRPVEDATRQSLGVPRVIAVADRLIRTVWLVLTLPFRLVFGLFGLAGRVAALVVGFSIMVLGAALLPGPLVLLGLPLFAFGLLLSLRSLG